MIWREKMQVVLCVVNSLTPNFVILLIRFYNWYLMYFENWMHPFISRRVLNWYCCADVASIHFDNDSVNFLTSKIFTTSGLIMFVLREFTCIRDYLQSLAMRDLHIVIIQLFVMATSLWVCESGTVSGQQRIIAGTTLVKMPMFRRIWRDAKLNSTNAWSVFFFFYSYDAKYVKW